MCHPKALGAARCARHDNAPGLTEARFLGPAPRLRWAYWRQAMAANIRWLNLTGRGMFNHIFFGFMEVIFIAFDMCIWQPARSFWDIDDFADVISCMAIVLFSPSGIFIIIASAFAMPASEQPVILDLAEAGIATMTSAAIKAARVNLEIMFAPQTEKSALLPTERNARSVL
jgi:hypothetical protein